MKPLVLAVLVSLAFALMFAIPANAQVTRHWNGEKWLFTEWTEFDGQVVAVEGIAWPSLRKALPSEQIVFPNGHVFVENAGWKKAELTGKLVRVTGVFETRRTSKAPRGAAGFGSAFNYFVITPLSVETIEKIGDGLLLPAKSKWVFVGMNVDEAKKLIADTRASEYLMATTAPADGSIPSSFKMPDGNILYFTSLDGRLVSMAKIVLNDPAQKSDDQWHEIPGYEIPVE